MAPPNVSPQNCRTSLIVHRFISTQWHCVSPGDSMKWRPQNCLNISRLLQSEPNAIIFFSGYALVDKIFIIKCTHSVRKWLFTTRLTLAVLGPISRHKTKLGYLLTTRTRYLPIYRNFRSNRKRGGRVHHYVRVVNEINFRTRVRFTGSGHVCWPSRKKKYIYIYMYLFLGKLFVLRQN